MNINWKTRVKNKAFWAAAIPAVLLLVQQVLAVFGVTVDFSTLEGQLVAIVGTVFALLALVGVAVDPNTVGLSDSARARSYDKPWDDSTDGKHAKSGEQDA